MQSNFLYFAFISYKREDEKLAEWLQKKLESYGFPVGLRKENPELPSKIRPIFRDKSDLSGGNLKKAIEEGLDSSKYLIVVCSPHSAKSTWVSKEVQYFIDHGREKYIIPFIIGGTPNASNPEDECFPEGLRQLTEEKELLGININEMGRDAAVIKVIARMFDLRFDTLWQRHKRLTRQRRLIGWIVILTLLLISTFITIWITRQNSLLKTEISRNVAQNITNYINNKEYYIALEKAIESVKNGYTYSIEWDEAVSNLLSFPWLVRGIAIPDINNPLISSILPLHNNNFLITTDNLKVYRFDGKNLTLDNNLSDLSVSLLEINKSKNAIISTKSKNRSRGGNYRILQFDEKNISTLSEKEYSSDPVFLNDSIIIGMYDKTLEAFSIKDRKVVASCPIPFNDSESGKGWRIRIGDKSDTINIIRGQECNVFTWNSIDNTINPLKNITFDKTINGFDWLKDNRHFYFYSDNTLYHGIDSIVSDSINFFKDRILDVRYNHKTDILNILTSRELLEFDLVNNTRISSMSIPEITYGKLFNSPHEEIWIRIPTGLLMFSKPPLNNKSFKKYSLGDNDYIGDSKFHPWIGLQRKNSNEITILDYKNNQSIHKIYLPSKRKANVKFLNDEIYGVYQDKYLSLHADKELLFSQQFNSDIIDLDVIRYSKKHKRIVVATADSIFDIDLKNKSYQSMYNPEKLKQIIATTYVNQDTINLKIICMRTDCFSEIYLTEKKETEIYKIDNMYALEPNTTKDLLFVMAGLQQIVIDLHDYFSKNYINISNVLPKHETFGFLNEGKIYSRNYTRKNLTFYSSDFKPNIHLYLPIGPHEILWYDNDVVWIMDKKNMMILNINVPTKSDYIEILQNL